MTLIHRNLPAFFILVAYFKLSIKTKGGLRTIQQRDTQFADTLAFQFLPNIFETTSKTLLRGVHIILDKYDVSNVQILAVSKLAGSDKINHGTISVRANRTRK